MGFHTGYGPGKLLTSAVVKVDWDLSLPPTGQCSGMNGSSVFSQRSLFRDLWEVAFLRVPVCSTRREEECWRSVSGPTLRLGGAVGVVTVAVCVQTGGFQKLQRSWGSEGDPERPCWRERCFALHAESTSPYLFRSKDLPPLKVCKALPWLLLMLPSALDSTAVSVIGIHLVIIH